jgi:hypothetical protein
VHLQVLVHGMPRALCSVLPEGSVLGLELIFDALTPPVSEGC